MGSSNFGRQRYNPLELMERWWPEADLSHIEYDPKMKASDRDYWRIEQMGSDGTMVFTIRMAQRALLPLVNKTTYYSQTPGEVLERVIDIRYEVGDMWHATVFGEVYLRCSKDRKYSGQRERVRIPVKCEYICK